MSQMKWTWIVDVHIFFVLIDSISWASNTYANERFNNLRVIIIYFMGNISLNVAAGYYDTVHYLTFQESRYSIVCKLKY